jgi:hypothetical protein
MSDNCYRVRVNGGIMPEAYEREAAAIEAAEPYNAKGYEASVEYHCMSGTHESYMRVWPSPGPMYTN